MTQPTEYEQVTYNDDAGAQIGNATTTKLGFYGTAPVVRPTLTGSVSSNACVSTIVAALSTLGLVTNSTAA